MRIQIAKTSRRCGLNLFLTSTVGTIKIRELPSVKSRPRPSVEGARGLARPEAY